jgi:hypothetical protein
MVFWPTPLHASSPAGGQDSGALILLIGFSRIYLSAHYLTDVAAGFLVGGFWLVVAFTAAEWTRGWKTG